ncbi:MAG TPA: hypothetical protein EYF95_08140 [Flavobacteriales bacterium]|nr:hypothetical protein [Flavobacteriales bacterium]HIK67926.1 hypothetical protein [Flavobacteriales bacterium]
MAFTATGESGRFTITDPQSVTLSAPNSGSYAHNVSMTISWTKTNFTSNIDLYWTTNTTFSTSNNILFNSALSSFGWNIPSSLSGTSIYVWVRKTSDSSVKDRSNSSISITGAVLSKTITDSIPISDAYTKTESTWRTYVYKTLSDNISLNDIWTKTDSTWREYFYRTLSDSISVADSWVKTSRLWLTIRTISDSISMVDTSTLSQRKWIKFATSLDDLTLGDTWTKTQRKWIKFVVSNDSLGLADVWTKTQRRWIKIRSFLESISVSDIIAKTERVWIHFHTVNETITLIDISTETEGVSMSDNIGISDSWTVSKAFPSIGYLLDGGGESLKSKWNTGWISPTDLSKNPIIRRINMDYKSDDDLTMKVYSNEDITTPVATKTFSSSSTPTHGSIRLGTRVKYFLLSIETVQSSNADVRIERIEIEVDT